MKSLSDTLELLKNLKRRKQTKLFCPRCGSPGIRLSGIGSWLTPMKYVCKDCGYNGLLVMELEKEKG
jgi:predicted RNA-binding Zn-ribbon protein involved in translation (DUF1610 family)